MRLCKCAKFGIVCSCLASLISAECNLPEASAVGQILTKPSSTLSMNSISLSIPNMISGEGYELPARPARQPIYYPGAI